MDKKKKKIFTITKKILDQCEEAIRYKFENRKLLQRALTHSSLRDKNGACNERLEFLGDAVLGLIISEYLFQTFQDFDEGDLSLIKSEVVSRATLARIAKNLKLDFCFACGRGVHKTKQGIPTSMLANVMEAVIGAIYLDRGIKSTHNFILVNFRQEIEKVIRNPYQKNYKSLLQCIAQKYFGNTPHYKILRAEGPNHTKTFTSCAIIGDRKFIAGKGKSKKEAEQSAAYAALQMLALENHTIGENLKDLLPPEKKNRLNNLISIPMNLFHNSKSLLQHITEKFVLPKPIYKKKQIIHREDKKFWFVSVRLGGRLFPEGTGDNRKRAERMAARKTLEILAEEYSSKYATHVYPQKEMYQPSHPEIPIWHRLSWLD